MNYVIVVAAFLSIALVESTQKSEITWTYYKKCCATGDAHSMGLTEESVSDVLTCSVRCQRDHNCSSFLYKAIRSTCVLQGVLTHPSSSKCDGSRVWYKVVDNPRLEEHRGTHKPQTKATAQQQESAMGSLQTGAPASFHHIRHMTLHRACEEGRLDKVKYILSTGLEDINCRNKKGFTPVMSAAWAGQEAVFDFLVRRDCDLSLITNAGNNILHIACNGGRSDIVKKLIAEHIFDIDCRGLMGWTPVIIAAHSGHREVFDLLVSKGCDLTVSSDKKDNLLHVACLGGNVDVVTSIISWNITSIESRGNQGRTPVLSAAARGHVKVVTLLESKGCNMRETDYLKRNILHRASMGGHVDMVRHMLRENIVGIESRDAARQTPVIIASVMGHIGVVDLLRIKGCNMRAVTTDGNNLLHAACGGGHVDMVQYILKKNIIGVESRGVYGKTPVLIAARQGHTGVVDLLRWKECNLKVADNNKNNILHAACLSGHVHMVKYVLKLNAVGMESMGYNGETAVMAAAKMGHVEVVDLLGRKGCNLRAVNQYGCNILYLACFNGHVDMVKYITKLKAVGLESRGYNGETAVMAAAKMGHVEVVDILRRKGCNLMVVDKYKNTILHHACFSGHTDMVKYILKLNGISMESRGYFGKSAVLMAVRQGHVRVVEILMRNGCDMKTLDDDGNNILHVACIGGHVNMVRFLLRLGVVSRRRVNRSGMTPVQVAKVSGHGEVIALLEGGKK